MIVTKSQKYADSTFSQISTYLKNVEELRTKKYKGLCKRAGGLLRTMGLIQFLVYLQSKGMKPAEIHHADLLSQLQASASTHGISNAKDVESFIEWVRTQNVPKYMQATREILSLLYWHKQLSDVLIEGTAEDQEGDQE